MTARRVLLRAGACLLLLCIDRALATLAVEVNAAGALLSPGGELHVGAVVVAGLFLIGRLSLACVFCVAVSWTASDLVAELYRRGTFFRAKAS